MNTKNSNIAINQHYVPQFLLKNFAFGKKDYIWALDKHTGKKFKANVRNVAAERGFYNIENEMDVASLEPFMCKIEENVAPIIKEIVKNKSLISVDDEAKRKLSAFLSVQLLRTKNYRSLISDALSQLGEKMKKFGMTEKQFIEDGFSDTEAMAKKIGLQSIADYQSYVRYFYLRDWVLFEKDCKESIYIGDHPIGLHNSQEAKGVFGNLGLSVKGVEIYLPLSKDLILGMWCPSIVEEFRNYAKQNSLLPAFVRAAMQKHIDFQESVMQSIESRTPLKTSSQNMELYNSLQVIHAERYVYSSEDDFDLVEKLIKENEKWKRGMRFKVG